MKKLLTPFANLDYAAMEVRIATQLHDEVVFDTELAEPTRDVREVVTAILPSWSFLEYDLSDHGLLIRWIHAGVPVQAGLRLFASKEARLAELFGGLVEAACFTAVFGQPSLRAPRPTSSNCDFSFEGQVRPVTIVTEDNPLFWHGAATRVTVEIPPSNFDAGLQARINKWATKIATRHMLEGFHSLPPFSKRLPKTAFEQGHEDGLNATTTKVADILKRLVR